MTRLRRSCSEDKVFLDELDSLEEHFIQRGYSSNVLDNARRKILKTFHRSLLLNKRRVQVNKKRDEKISFITGYNTCSQPIYKILRKHWHLLSLDRTLVKYISKKPSVTYRRGTTLRQILCPSYLPPMRDNQTWLPNKPKGFFKCTQCNVCPYALNGTTEFQYNTLMKYNIQEFINCNTRFVVYCIVCYCGLIYIGSTLRPLKQRIQEHIRAIRNNNLDYPLAVHSNSTHPLKNMTGIKFHGISHVQSQPRGGNRLLTLRKMETQWILKLRAVKLGLNTDKELHVFFVRMKTSLEMWLYGAVVCIFWWKEKL